MSGSGPLSTPLSSPLLWKSRSLKSNLKAPGYEMKMKNNKSHISLLCPFCSSPKYGMWQVVPEPESTPLDLQMGPKSSHSQDTLGERTGTYCPHTCPCTGQKPSHERKRLIWAGIDEQTSQKEMRWQVLTLKYFHVPLMSAFV